jgi:hypothetical protein
MESMTMWLPETPQEAATMNACVGAADEKVEVVVMQHPTLGISVYLNGFRISGPKPYGGEREIVRDTGTLARHVREALACQP